MITLLFMLVLSGCSGAETAVPEEKAAGYEVIENTDERFLTVVVDAQEKANVTVKKTQKDPAEEAGTEEAHALTLLGTERIFGTLLEEEGYYEVQVACGEAVQKRVIHVEDNSIYSLWFSF